jgi:hypothetical protein
MPEALAFFILGVLATEAARYLWMLYENREQAKAIKTLVKVEAEQNLSWVASLRQSLAVEETQLRGPAELQLPNFLGRMELPVWSHRIWESQLSRVATVLDSVTIRKIQEFHGELDKLTEKKIAIMQNENQAGYRKQLYNECETIMKDLIQRGSPVL